MNLDKDGTKRINYFDLGLHTGRELGDFVFKIFPKLNITNYFCYGFDACKKFADLNKYNYKNYNNINIYHRAISDQDNKSTRLYHVDPRLQPGEVGHSIYRTKTNVTDNFETVDSSLFSTFLKTEVPSFVNDINILKVNIEGAEYPLFKDLVACDYLKYFPMIIGAGHDVDKVSELDSDEYWKLINDNQIEIKRYISDWKPEKNYDVTSLLSSLLK